MYQRAGCLPFEGAANPGSVRRPTPAERPQNIDTVALTDGGGSRSPVRYFARWICILRCLRSREELVCVHLPSGHSGSL
jgi:hypothetical protein